MKINDFSIIIPVFNAEKYIARCIESVLAQTGVTYEIICIDDASRDNSANILNKYKNNNKITIINNKENKGLAYSRNEGIKCAKGRYIWFVDADDYIAANSLKIIKEEIESDDIDILGFNTLEISEGIEIGKSLGNRRKYNKCWDTGIQAYKDMYQNGVIDSSACTKIYKKDFLIHNNLYFKEGIIYEDEVFLLDTFFYARRIKNIEGNMYIYCRHQNSLTTRRKTINYLESELYLISVIKTHIVNCKDTMMLNLLESRLSREIGCLVKMYKEISVEEIIKVKNNRKMNLDFISLLAGVYGGFFPYKINKKSTDYIIKNRQVYIYGIGDVGKSFFELINDLGITIEGIIESEKNREMYKNIPIYSIMEASKLNKKIPVYIMMINKQQIQAIKQSVIQAGFDEKKVFTYYEVL